MKGDIMLKRTLIALAVTIVAAGNIGAQNAGKVKPLTAEDYAAIYQLYATYPYSFDGSGTAGLQWGDVFTADGIHINATGNEFFKGRDMLNAFAGGKLRLERSPSGANSVYWLDLSRPNGKNQFNVGHFITNILLEPTAEGVKSKVYLMGVNVAGGQIFPRGIYFDTIEKTAEGWRFKVKHFIQGNTPVPETVPAVFKTLGPMPTL
jgi:hypothetical protein